MSNKVKGNVDVGRYGVTNGKNIVRSVNGEELFDSNGNLEMDAYTKDELNKMISVLPVSRYGTLGYLPPGVNGSFEGGTWATLSNRPKVIYEDDGTLVYLRPGTNGSFYGLYYTYINSAENTSNITPVQTQARYAPTFIPDGKRAVGVYETSDNLIWGAIGDENNPQNGIVEHFIAYTNGTLNQELHTGRVIPTIPIGINYMLLDGDYLYGIQYVGMSTGMGFRFYRANSSDIEGTGEVIFTEITDWTVNGFWGTDLNQPYMKFFDSGKSGDITRRPVWLYEDEDSGKLNIQLDYHRINKLAASPDGKLIRGFFGYVTYDFYLPVGRSSNNDDLNFAFSYVIDVENKTVSLDPGYSAPVSYNFNTTTGELNVTNNMPFIYADFAGIGWGWSEVPSTVVNNGTTYSVINAAITSWTHKVARAKHNFNTFYDFLNYSQLVSSQLVGRNVTPLFGSEIGTQNTGLIPLPNQYYMVSTYTNTYANGANAGAMIMFKPDVNSVWTYKSVIKGSITGYAPTNNRIRQTNVTVSNRTVLGSMCYIKQDNSVELYGSVLNKITKEMSKTINVDIDGNVIPSEDTISITDDGFMVDIIKQIALDNSLEILNDKVMAELVISSVSGLPDILAGLLVTTNLACYAILTEVTLDSKTNPTSATVQKINKIYLVNGAGGSRNDASFAPASARNRLGSTTVLDMGTHFAVSYNMYMQVGVAGNQRYRSFMYLYNKTTGYEDDSFIAFANYTNTAEGQQPISLPFLGAGVICIQNGGSDNGNKIVFCKIGSTPEEYYETKNNPDITINDGRTYPMDRRTVIVSSDVEQGWIVYFTEATPLLISGNIYILPVINYDLRDYKADPRNSTFYVYVALSQGLANYVISTTPLSETNYRMFIGTILTNNNQIESMNINKISRLDLVRPSTTPIGSGFPVSTGLPSQTGTINW